ncbi:MAG: type IV pilus modification PilV family protein [Thermoanaerobaculia bacterium]
MELRRRVHPDGMTLIEVVIASLLLLVIALGVLPIFLRSMTQTVSGEVHTELANHARTRAEEYVQLPFSSAQLTIPSGDTEAAVTDYYWPSAKTWRSSPPPESEPGVRWERTTTVRQFHVIDYMAALDRGEPPAPLAGGAPAGSVHLKEITVRLSTPAGGPAYLGGDRALTVRAIKSH